MPVDRTLSVEGLRFETDGPVATITIDAIAEQNRLSPASKAFRDFLIEQGGPLIDSWA